MSAPFYVEAYWSACRRHAENYQELFGDDRWHEWVEAVGRINQAWKWSVDGMLSQSEFGDPEIWHALGDAFVGGHGVERDWKAGETWFRKAVGVGHGPSMVRLGIALRREWCTSEEIAESVLWFHRAADLGEASAMIWLGFAYRDGTGVSPDRCEAIDWFCKSHEAGATNAADLAGRLLAQRSEDHLEAVGWLRTAVEGGSDSSWSSLASIYENRESPAHNPEEAFHCWSQVAACRPGEARLEAMFMLAYACRDGTGTARDSDNAKEWLRRILREAPEKTASYRCAAKKLAEMDEELF